MLHLKPLRLYANHDIGGYMGAKASHTETVAIVVAVFAAANLAHVLLWYFIVFNAPSIIGAISQVAQTGRSSGGTRELLAFSTQLTVVVMRWGLIPIYIGVIGDLTLVYIGFGLVVGALLAVWAQRRW